MASVAAHDRREVRVGFFQSGDVVRCLHNDEACVVIWTRADWLWLDPVEYVDAAPFSGRADDYVLVRRGLS